MYGLLGYSENIKNIYRLAAPFVGTNSVRTSQDLKPFYIEFLNRHQPEHQVEFSRDLIVRDPKQAKNLIGAFSASKLNDLSQEAMLGEFFESESRHSFEQSADEALRNLRELNPEASDLFSLSIHSILMCGSNENSAGLRAHGGTSSKCVGLMWLSMQGKLSMQDLLELFVHEMTHTLVFLDERNKPQFDYSQMSFEENWARSSILKRQRPMDKVVHSILVAYEVLYARANYLPNVEKLSVHPDSEEMKTNIRIAVESVNTHPNRDQVCKPRAIELINKVASNLDKV